jgi:phosphopantetheinyl transferase (holo-ACP synthase)
MPERRFHTATIVASTRAVEGWWEAGGADGPLLHWFTPAELATLASRRNAVAAVAARLAGKAAIRKVLARAGLEARALPILADIQILRDDRGRPVTHLPAPVAGWLSSEGLGLEVSLSHDERRVLASAVVAP